MIPIFGDTHGKIDHWKISQENVKKTCNGVLPPQILIVGDFGFVWNNDPENETEKYWATWVSELPYEIYTLEGNHENFIRIRAYPIVERFGGQVHQVAKNVFFFIHGEIYTIEDKTFFCFGGAQSIDRGSRTSYVSWWPEEIPSSSDFYRGRYNLESKGFKVDYILTHTCPQEVLPHLIPDPEEDTDPTTSMLSTIHLATERKMWFFGHFHVDKTFIVDDNIFKCLYNEAHIIK